MTIINLYDVKETNKFKTMKTTRSLLLITLFTLGLFLSSCSSTDDVVNIGNNPPSLFSSNTIDTTFDGATIEWTEAVDIDGDTITYAIILEGQEIASGGTALMYSFSGLDSDTLYSGYVEARDGKGGTSQADFFFTTEPEIIIRTLNVEYREFIAGEGYNLVAFFEIPEEEDAISYSVVVTDYSLNTIPATIGRTYSWTPDDVLPTGNNVGTGSSGLTEFSPGVYHANTNVSGANVANTSAISDLIAYYSAITGTAELTIVLGSN